VTREAVLGGLALCALFAVSACSDDRKTPAATSAPDTAVAPTAETPRDSLGRPVGKVIRSATMNGTTQKNGTIEVIAMELVKPAAGFPGNFSTYKSQDVQMASMKIGSVGTITLTPMFGAATDPNAFIQIQFDTAKLAVTDPAGAAFEAATKGVKITKPAVSDVPYPWADAAKSFRYSAEGKPLVTVMFVGHHGPTTFHVMAQSPPAHSEAMAQRLNLILKHWRWDDDYSYLVPSGLKPSTPPQQPDSASKAPAAPTKSK
jgi:hypothetical protein